MTELAYLANIDAAYVRAFRARVTALPPGAIVLERTYFYPTGGGQACDRGTLALGAERPVEVLEVVKSGAAVLHRVRGDPAVVRSIEIGAELDGTVDWERRHRHMRLHTAQHFASARIFARTGLRTRRANLAGAGATVDLEGPLAPDALGPVQDDLRDAVAHPQEVRVRMVPRAEWEAQPAAGRSGLVPLPPQVDPVRVVEIDASDACPCGGTHVRSTGEIGELRWSAPVALGGGATRVAFSLVDPVTSTPPA